MEQVRNLYLEEIFNLQDKIMQQAIEDHKTEYEFVKDCIGLVINRRFIEEHITERDNEKLAVVHAFLNDALSTLINSFKMALYGCLNDSMTLLRPVVEELAIVNYVVLKGLFKTANYELNNKLRELRFGEITKSINDGEAIKELHGKISDLAAHGTSSRIKRNRFDLHGQSLPTVGMALDPKRAKSCLYEIMKASLYMIRILTDFYSTEKEVISQEFFAKGKKLETRFSAFKELNR